MTRRLRALHVIPAVAARYGGPSAAVIGMCRALEAAGVGTVIATTDADGSARLPVAVGRLQTFDGIETVFFRRAFGEGFKWSSGIASWLAQHAVEFDVVHVHAVFSHSSIAAGRAARRATVPYVVRPLGTLNPWSLRQKRVQKQLLMRLAVRGLLTGAAGMHYTSEEEGRLAEQEVPGLPQALVVPLGIDDAYFERALASGQTPEHPYVLAMSRLDPKKRLEVVIRAFHDLASDARLEPWRLTIAGDGDPDYVSKLKQLASAGPSADRIDFRGWVSGRDKMALIRRATLFVSPSKQENFGLSAVEALAAGVPALLSSGVNVAADVARAGAGWDVDEASFGTVLADAMRDEEGRRARASRARAFAEAFRWPAVAARLIGMYEHVQARVSRVASTPVAVRS